MDKEERCNLINQLLEVISKQDRGFFETKGNLARFELRNNKVYFIDNYTKEAIYCYNTGRYCRSSNNFSHGGTLWALVNDFREWIVTGKYSDGKNGYGGLYATCWGMSVKCKDAIIDKAKEIGYLKSDSISFRDYCRELINNGNDWLLGCCKEDIINELKGN